MPIVVECPKCRTSLKADDRLIGATTVCPKCGAKVAIEPSTTPPPSAHGSGAGASTMVAIVLAVCALGGLLALGAVGLAAALWLYSVVPPTVTATATPPVLPPQMVAVQVVPGGSLVVTQQPAGMPGPPLTSISGGAMATSPAVDTTDWHPLPENSFGVTLRFPAEPTAFEPFAVTDASEEEESVAEEFAAAIAESADAEAFRAQLDGTTYSYTAFPFDLSSDATEEYLSRLASMIELTQPGFKKRSDARLALAPPAELSLPQSLIPAYQVTLDSPDATRIVRIFTLGKVLVSLTVEGPAHVADDPRANAFLDSFGLRDRPFSVTYESAGEAASPTPPFESLLTNDGPEGLRSLPIRQSSNEPKEFAGQKIGFRVSLPTEIVDRPTVEQALAISDDDTTGGIVAMREAQKTFATTELMVAEQGDRRLIVIAVAVDPTDLEWYDVGGKVSAGLDPWTGILFPPHLVSATNVVSSDEGPRGTARTVQAMKTYDGENVLMLRRWVGQYGFLLIYESDEPVEADDPSANAFFDSLVDPADAKLP